MRAVKTLWLADVAKYDIAEHARRRRLRETGGALFGYEADDAWIVEKALGPGPQARHERFRLVSDRTHLQEAIDREIATSDGARYYLGEWHTHLLGPPRPSGRDRASAAAIADRPKTGLRQPLVLIQATIPWGRSIRPGRLCAFYFNAVARDLLPLDVRPFTAAA